MASLALIRSILLVSLRSIKAIAAGLNALQAGLMSLTNVTSQEKRRLDLKVDISYDSDLKKAKEVLRRIIDAEERIMKDEEVQIFVDSLGASSVVLGLRVWVKAEDYWAVRWKLLEDIKLTMDAEGIEIPYQQVTVHVNNEK